ncbi:hypothetical protein [Chryseobacterium defluvii]|uniref:Uncharacterized protein n=1 Tax=Chryseobacterium defluvii TaxID=160396 RepID=A0A495SF81_9FLAO|nr:hypothetical protein [Chryseobacterium defluvii]RKS98201.1 hypothetical protein BCF58_2341 [Chryseobacterium defluvii]
MKIKQIPGVPIQKSGGFHDTESRKDYDTPSVASEKFDILKERFFSINQWKSFSGAVFADFTLYNSNGNPIKQLPEVGDFIRIDIPGPGETEAKGYDWVEIINISHQQADESESYIMTCRPSQIPGITNNSHIAHFYSQASTSTFMIQREGSLIKAGIYGRNEKPNFNARFIDKIRNLLIALGGMCGFSKIQWKSLTDGLLDFT